MQICVKGNIRDINNIKEFLERNFQIKYNIDYELTVICPPHRILITGKTSHYYNQIDGESKMLIQIFCNK